MVSAGAAQLSQFAIPPGAVAEWRELSRAIDTHGPPVCASSPEPEAWWQPARFNDALDGCRTCPVAGQCLAYALAADEREGVWGARLPAERERGRSRRRRRASA